MMCLKSFLSASLLIMATSAHAHVLHYEGSDRRKSCHHLSGIGNSPRPLRNFDRQSGRNKKGKCPDFRDYLEGRNSPGRITGVRFCCAKSKYRSRDSLEGAPALRGRHQPRLGGSATHQEPRVSDNAQYDASANSPLNGTVAATSFCVASLKFDLQ